LAGLPGLVHRLGARGFDFTILTFILADIQRTFCPSCCLVGLTAIPLYVLVADSTLLLAGAILMGVFCAGMWGVVPAYLSERFPTAVRGVGCSSW